MKKYLFLCLIVCSLFPSLLLGQKKLIRVAIYNDAGGGDLGVENVEACLSNDSVYHTKRVDARDIRSGMLRSFDVLVQAGGSGSKQAKTLEPTGIDSIRDFVKRGGGYLGICAGAYLATVHYDWSLGILNAMVVDREHWNRGHGEVQIGITGDGRNFFGIDSLRISVQYGQGPLLAPADNPELPAYKELATYKSEITENGAPEGVMLGTTAIAQSTYGEGKVIAVSPHPEKSETLRFMIAKMVQWLGTRQ